MTSHLICTSEIIKSPNKAVLALFHHFFLQTVHIAEIRRKVHETKTSKLPVPCISQILKISKFYSGKAGISILADNK